MTRKKMHPWGAGKTETHSTSTTPINGWKSGNTTATQVSYLQIPCRKVLLPKLTGAKLVHKLPALYKTEKLFAIVTTVRHWTTSWPIQIQCNTATLALCDISQYYRRIYDHVSQVASSRQCFTRKQCKHFIVLDHHFMPAYHIPNDFTNLITSREVYKRISELFTTQFSA